MTGAPPIPEAFLERMSKYLGDDYPAFARCLDEGPRSGLRVNTLKLSPEEFRQISPFELVGRVNWCPSAFHLPPSIQAPGLHPYHLAGLYYLQDPSAMAPAELLAPQPGERVLDLAAAPGGKATQLAALMRGEGLLVANEIKTKRVGHLAQNVERWGAGNVVITNETPEALADHFGAFFDRVLLDAPCSGEGMFRKDMGARADWSLDMVQGCSLRQSSILRIAAKLVRPGGYLLYSTCTFAPEENEAVIGRLLEETARSSPFEVVRLPQLEGFSPGRPDWLDLGGVRRPQSSSLEGLQRLQSLGTSSALQRAVRLFPHRVAGEGHFACLLRRASSAGGDTLQGNDRLAKPSRQQIGFWRGFVSEVLRIDVAEENLRALGGRLYLVPEGLPDLGQSRLVHPGVWLGSLKKDRFEPAHPLALFLRKGQAAKVLDLEPRDPLLAAYLRGESFEAAGPPGWLVLMVDGYPLGWGKRVQGNVKNHFPRGWVRS